MTKINRNVLNRLILIILICAGFAANIFKITLFYNVDLIFGSFFVMLVISLYGPVWGTAAGVVAASYTYVLWNHPYAIIIFTCEAVFTGFIFERRKINLVFINAVYWFIIGMPLVYFFYHVVMKMDNNGAVLIMLKQAVNGIFNALSARLLLMLVRNRGARIFLPRWSGKWSFTNVLFNTIMAFVLFPSLFFTSLSGRIEEQDIEQEVTTQLDEKSQTGTQFITNWLNESRLDIESCAYHIQNALDEKHPEQKISGILQHTRKLQNDFILTAAVDPEGRVIASSGSESMTPEVRRGLIEQLYSKPSGENPNFEMVVTEIPASVSRRYAKTRAVTITSPFYDRNGIYRGSVFAVKPADTMSSFLNSILVGRKTEAILLDSKDDVILSTSKDSGKMLEIIRQSTWKSSYAVWSPRVKLNVSVMERWKDSIFLKKTDLSVAGDWKLYCAASIGPYQNRLYKDSFRNLLIIIVLIFITGILSRVIALRYVRPVRQLQQISTNLPQRLNDGGDLNWPRSVLTEISALITNFRFMAISLKRTIIQLRIANGNLSKQKEKADAANKAKSRFLANMSHDIRTPLTAIRGMASLILEDKSLITEHRTNITAIKESAGILMKMLNNILDLSKIEAGKLSLEIINFNIRETIEHIVRLYRVSAELKGLKLTYSIDQEIPQYLKGDPLRIQQVILNLAGNALKFTEQGEIRIELKSRRELPLNRFDETSSEFFPVTFYIRDTGIGISGEDQSKIFESFSQADVSIARKFGGSGLGLTISRELVALMNGRLALTSSPGEGSVFFFTIPFLPGEEPDDAVQPEQDVSIALSGIAEGLSILIAEDDRINRKLAEHMLRTTGFTVTAAEDGEAAMEKMKNGLFDIAVLDIHMPRLNGFETAKAIRRGDAGEGNTQIPIIALTASMIRDDIDECKTAGINECIQKPLDLKQFLSILKKYYPRDEKNGGRN